MAEALALIALTASAAPESVSFEAFRVAFAAVFSANFVLAQFLGLCPFLGVSDKTSSAVGMGSAVIFVMTMASAVTFIIYRAPGVGLKALGLDEFLYIVVFILVIACLVQFVEMFVRKSSDVLYRALGIYLPLITTNCAVLGVTKLNVSTFEGLSFGTGFLLSTLQGFFAGLGFMLAMMLMSGMREKLRALPVARHFRGFPIAFIIACSMALAFLGFSGMV